ncbi:MAG: DUF349 domain-containing protein [Bacteroidota bacterium]
MSNETNNTQEQATSKVQFENDVAYVDADGNLYQKDNQLFSGKQIGALEGPDYEQQLEPYKQKFEELRQLFSELKETIAESDSAQAQRKAIQQFEEAASEMKAVGPFDEIASELETLRSEIVEEVTQDSDPETQSAAPVVDDQDSDEAAEDDQETIEYYQEIVEKAEEVAKETDWSYVAMELGNLRQKWDEGPEYHSDTVKQLWERLEQAQEDFEQRREQHYEELNRRKEENLEKKKELLNQLQSIVDNENWKARDKVKSIEGKWNSINLLPADRGAELDEKFQALIKEFKDHKVDYLVQKKQQEEDNLAGKLLVLDKMEQLVASIDENTSNWKELEDELDKLKKQWRKIGHVPQDKNQEVWDRYKNALDGYDDAKFKYNKDYRKRIEKFTKKKKQLCEEAEALLEADDLAKAARKINKLHRRWKKTGNLPQKDENELWNRFKAATDAFNDRKSDNMELLREQEEKHYQQKLDLIEEANELKSTDDWDAGHKGMQRLMDRWKKIGPVPRKKSNKIWKQFKGAMDEFYDRRRAHFRSQRKEQKKNLKRKEEILDKLNELTQYEDPDQAVEEAKPLQEKFKDVGYVPIKQKNKIWKKYRETLDVIYGRYRAANSTFADPSDLAAEGIDKETRQEIKKKQDELAELKKSTRKLEEEVLQYKDSKTFFTSTSDDNPLMKEIEDKIAKAEAKLNKSENRMAALEQEIEDLKEMGSQSTPDDEEE